MVNREARMSGEMHVIISMMQARMKRAARCAKGEAA